MAKSLTPKLYNYQLEDTSRLLEILKTRKAALLLSEAGAGKTPISIAVGDILKPQHIVVICPSVMKGTWEHEINTWSTRNHQIQILNKGKELIRPDTTALILSYDLSIRKELRGRLAAFLNSAPSLLIGDEFHYCKSLKAIRTNVFLYAFLPRALHTLLLTGTPMPKGLPDIYPLVAAADPEVEPFHQFCERYAYPMPTVYGDGLVYVGLRNVPELKDRLRQYTIRRFKKDVLKQLPKRIYSHLYLPIPQALAEQSMEHVEQIRKAIIRNRLEKDIRMPKYSTLRQELGLIKLPAICDWLTDFFDTQPDEPIVLFSIHKAVIQGLNEYLQKKKISYGEISGRIPSKERTQVVEDFQNKKIQVINGQIVASGTGITLTRARTILFAELSWVAAELDQAISRCHRISQKRPVQVFFALASPSIDTALINTVRSKLSDSQKLFGKNEK